MRDIDDIMTRPTTRATAPQVPKRQRDRKFSWEKGPPRAGARGRRGAGRRFIASDDDLSIETLRCMRADAIDRLSTVKMGYWPLLIILLQQSLQRL